MPSDTALHKAAHNGDKGACLQILDDKSVDVNAPGAGDRRALHRAAGANHAELCALLLERGAEIDLVTPKKSTAELYVDLIVNVGMMLQADKSGRTALHWACISGHKEAAIVLIQKGASINAVTTTGMTSLHGAAEGGKVEIVRLLMENKADSTLKDSNSKLAFDLAMDNKHKAVIKVMKEMGDAAAQSASCVVQ